MYYLKKLFFIDNKPIFSVDIHPNGGRFATGGQGGSGGRIVIWNLGPVLDENDEVNVKIPKMLCQMDNHLGKNKIQYWPAKYNVSKQYLRCIEIVEILNKMSSKLQVP